MPEFLCKVYQYSFYDPGTEGGILLSQLYIVQDDL